MSAAHGNGPAAKGPAAKGPPKGEDEKKNDTIVKIAGVAIATGIAYSIYRSVFVGKKTEEPHHHHGKHHSAHHKKPEQICVDKPDGLAKVEAGVKEKFGEFRAGEKKFEEAVVEKGKEVVSAAEAEGKEIKDVFGDGLKKAGKEEKKVEQKFFGLFNWLGGQAKKEEKELETDVEKAKTGAGNKIKEAGKLAEKEGTDKKVKEPEKWTHKAEKDAEKRLKDAQQWAAKEEKEIERKIKDAEQWAVKEEKEIERKVKDTEKSAEEKGKGFFHKSDEKLGKGKQEVQKGLDSAGSNVEKTGAAMVHKIQKVSPGSKPHHHHHHGKKYKEYGIVKGDTLWSISKKFGVSIDELKVANGIWNADFIVAGDTLAIPK
ncbi:unnamed protein product [Calypogeia fissa]